MAKPASKVKALVMMSVAPGQAYNVVVNLKQWGRKALGNKAQAYVTAAWVVTGEYDVVASVEAASNGALLNLVSQIVSGSQRTHGKISSTHTMLTEDGPWED